MKPAVDEPVPDERPAGGPVERFGLPLVAALVLLGLVVAGGLAYASQGGGSRDDLITQMLVNIVLVVGLQVFIGNTGILSFGHMAFAAISGYAFAVLTMAPDKKDVIIPDAPFGLVDVELTAAQGALIALAVTVLIALPIGVAVVRSGGIAATMITLALLFVVHEVANNWPDLTNGGGGLSFLPRLDGRGWIYLVVVIAVVGARLFRETRTGRWTQAAQEDPVAAVAAGINIRRPQLAAWIASIALIAVGAVLRVMLLGSMTPAFFFFDFTLLTLAMLVVGGRRSVTGAILGVVVITAGTELTRYLAGEDVEVTGLDWLLRPGLNEIFLGGAMLGFMLLRPEGLLGDWELDHWLRRRLSRAVGETPAPEPLPAATPADNGRAALTLRASDLRVEFGGFVALDGVSVEASADEIVGLIGPNGAGKTTLLNAVTGIVPTATGTWQAGNHDLTGAPPYRTARTGLARTFQNLRLFSSMSVRENVTVAAMAADKYRAGHEQIDVDRLLGDAGLWEIQDRRARELDYGAQRKLELARAAALAPDFLLLDEPTSGMGDAESAAMIEHIRNTAAAVGAGVLVIDHDLHFITNICDRIYVLDHGVLISSGSPAEIQADPQVQAAYLGTAATPT